VFVQLENDPTATPGSSRPNFAALLGPAAASGGHTTPTKPDVSGMTPDYFASLYSFYGQQRPDKNMHKQLAFFQWD
jgi:hypothetical protein